MPNLLLRIAVLLVALVAAALLAACGEDGQSSGSYRYSSLTPTSPPTEAPATLAPEPTPTTDITPAATVTWAITSETVKVGSNYRFVDVVLSQRVSEPELTAIAERIRQQSPDHPVVHILYWIDGMDTDGSMGAWATTRFEQDRPVEVRINDFNLTPTPTPRATPTPRPTRTPVTYAACDNVPT